jgi:hypothetical protein
MKTNTFEHLESLARSKGIICERRSVRKIELTTPCGGTTAECATVSEAFDTLRNDPTFSDLPIKAGSQAPAPTEPFRTFYHSTDDKGRPIVNIQGQILSHETTVALRDELLRLLPLGS